MDITSMRLHGVWTWTAEELASRGPEWKVAASNVKRRTSKHWNDWRRADLPGLRRQSVSHKAKAPTIETRAGQCLPALTGAGDVGMWWCVELDED